MFSTAGRKGLTYRSGSLLYRTANVVSPSYLSKTSRSRKDNAFTESNGDDSHGEQKQKPGGSYTRVLAIFGVGIPIGWAVHAINEGSDAKGVKPTDFVEYALVKKEDISSTCSIFTLKPAESSTIDAEKLYDERAITSVQFKQPQLQIARAYTVLPRTEGQGSDELRFLIRKEQNGEVSGYLHRLAMSSTLEMRGPSVEYLLPENVTEVVFLAGGTGIAPALQVADKLVEHASVQTLWANRRREDCAGGVSDTKHAVASTGWNLFTWWSNPVTSSTVENPTSSTNNAGIHSVVEQVKSMKRRCDSNPTAKGGLQVDYYVDEEGTFIRPADVLKLLNPQIQSSGNRLLFVSGPDGFVNYWAGPKQWVSGHEVQGPLGGALAALDLRGWHVIKL